MGNSSSSSGRGHHDDSVDYGFLVPQGVYTGPQDWNRPIVSQLIISRKLAPFYRPLEDYEETWGDDQILAARKELPDSDHSDNVTRIDHSSSSPSHSNSSKSKRPGPLKELVKPEAQVYRGAVECPICFLFYPPNINRSRCCDQAICTECFVQIKRSEPTTTHLVSEPAACPYCVQENFGIIYTPPPWRAGVGNEHGLLSESRSRSPTEPPTLAHKRRQKSCSADSPEVVLIDHIRPDWEAKLEAVRAAVARRANRRIIMRQVGDRLIPIGVTSGRVHALSPEEAAAAAASAENGSRRTRRRGPGVGDALEQVLGMTGPDLEELMLMEAMRLSLLEHEEQQRKEAEERRKKEAAEAASSAAVVGQSIDRPNTNPTTAPIPGPSTLAPQDSLSTSGSSSPSSSPSHLPSPSRSGASRSQTGRKSWSVSRSRTPSPLPPNPRQNPPVSEENQAEWRSQNEGPRPFSTLNAVITTTSTVTSLLASNAPRSRSVTPDPDASGAAAVKTSTLLGSSAPTQRHANHSTTVPTIRVGVEKTAPCHSETSEHSATSRSTSIYSDAPLPPIPKAEASAETSPVSSADETTTSASTSMSSSAFHGAFENGPNQPGMLNASYGTLGPSSATGKRDEIDAPTVQIEDLSR